MRPRFLDQPLCWTRTPRDSRSRVEQAYAGVRCSNPRMHPAEKIVTVGSVISLVALVVLMATGAVK